MSVPLPKCQCGCRTKLRLGRHPYILSMTPPVLEVPVVCPRCLATLKVEVGDAALFCVVQRTARGKWGIFPDVDFGLTPAEAREVADWCDAQEATRPGGVR